MGNCHQKNKSKKSKVELLNEKIKNMEKMEEEKKKMEKKIEKEKEEIEEEKKKMDFNELRQISDNVLPEFCLYYDIDREEAKKMVKNGGIERIKSEFVKKLGNNGDIFIKDVQFGSLYIKTVFVPNNAENLIRNVVEGKKPDLETVDKVAEMLSKYMVDSLRNSTPAKVNIVNQEIFQNPESNIKRIKKLMKNFTEKSEFNSKNLQIDFYNDLKDKLKKNLSKGEKSLKDNISILIDSLYVNKRFDEEFNKARKESIFEYKIVGLIPFVQDRTQFNMNKNACPNKEDKILFHGTGEEALCKILPTNFKVSKICYYGLGIYFTDQLDYAQFYPTRNFYGEIPEIGSYHTVVTSEVFYDSKKKKRIYDKELLMAFDHYPQEEKILEEHKDKVIEKGGLHYVEVDCKDGNPIPQDGPEPETGFIGREYVVSYKEQILPLFGMVLERTDTCIIWRDNHFLGGEYYYDLQERRCFASEMSGHNLYIEADTENALSLVWRKKYNKVILITNVGENKEGKKFIDKAREILGFNAIALFYADWEGHLEWIKEYPNSLFTNTQDLYEEYIMNFNEEGILKLKEKAELRYNVKFKKFSNFFDYPLYDRFKDGDGEFSDLDFFIYQPDKDKLSDV